MRQPAQGRGLEELGFISTPRQALPKLNHPSDAAVF